MIFLFFLPIILPAPILFLGFCTEQEAACLCMNAGTDLALGGEFHRLGLHIIAKFNNNNYPLPQLKKTSSSIIITLYSAELSTIITTGHLMMINYSFYGI